MFEKGNIAVVQAEHLDLDLPVNTKTSRCYCHCCCCTSSLSASVGGQLEVLNSARGNKQNCYPRLTYSYVAEGVFYATFSITAPGCLMFPPTRYIISISRPALVPCFLLSYLVGVLHYCSRSRTSLFPRSPHASFVVGLFH